MKFRELYEDWEDHDSDKMTHEILTGHGMKLGKQNSPTEPHGYNTYHGFAKRNDLMRDLKSVGWEDHDRSRNTHTLARYDPGKISPAVLDLHHTLDDEFFRADHHPHRQLK